MTQLFPDPAERDFTHPLFTLTHLDICDLASFSPELFAAYAGGVQWGSALRDDHRSRQYSQLGSAEENEDVWTTADKAVRMRRLSAHLPLTLTFSAPGDLLTSLDLCFRLLFMVKVVRAASQLLYAALRPSNVVCAGRIPKLNSVSSKALSPPNKFTTLTKSPQAPLGAFALFTCVRPVIFIRASSRQSVGFTILESRMNKTSKTAAGKIHWPNNHRLSRNISSNRRPSSTMFDERMIQGQRRQGRGSGVGARRNACVVGLDASGAHREAVSGRTSAGAVMVVP
ncbi:hypothetical protein K438DRAFT_1775697 [Mycena galopus ATCC 62051]|nr:hypothetical protein K438DRAFT_1775697 [Mycena galopus ATCC 62051]